MLLQYKIRCNKCASYHNSYSPKLCFRYIIKIKNDLYYLNLCIYRVSFYSLTKACVILICSYYSNFFAANKKRVCATLATDSFLYRMI